MKLSVKMLTFKHDNYIAQAINGVLMQVTDFDFELIISDDCSPDNTEQIVKDIQNSHPKGHLIKYLRQKKNIGVLPNGLFALQQCKGKYIAFCEGDDYWTDPNKLQQQVDFLESNGDYTMTFHSVYVKNEIEGINYQYPIPKKDLTLSSFYNSI
jgi:glycosyltransferase involved in cell wall biosynthesis